MSRILAKSFNEIQGLTAEEAIDAASLSYSRERLESSETKARPGLDTLMYTAPNGSKINHPIRSERAVVDYPTITRFFIEQLEKTGVEYKIKSSQLAGNGDLYQEYVLNHDIQTPDGESVSAMILARASLLYTPLIADFGTYRYICANGAKVGKTVGSLKVNSKVARELVKVKMTDKFALAFTRLEEVGLRYKALGEKSLKDALDGFLRNENVSFGLKRFAFTQLAEEGFIQVNPKAKLVDLKSNPAGNYTLTKDGNAWHLYNALTNQATHEVDSLASRASRYAQISEALGV